MQHKTSSPFQQLSGAVETAISQSQSELVTEIQRLSREVILPKRELATRMFKASHNNGQEIVTSTDIEVSEALLKIARRFFKHSETEESLTEKLQFEEPFWQIDPIDGTKLYAPDFPEEEDGGYEAVLANQKLKISRLATRKGFGVMAALMEPTLTGEYLSRVAILHIPATSETWMVGLDRQVLFQKGDSAPVLIAESRPLPGKLRVGVSTKYTYLPHELDPAIRYAQSTGRELEIYDLGGAASYFAAFLRGEIDFFTFGVGGPKSWDWAPGYALLTAIGASVSKLNGDRFSTLSSESRLVLGGVRAVRAGI